jgi:hypothetical protein
MGNTDEEKIDRMRRFKAGVDEAVKKGCGDPEGGMLAIKGGPWVPCPGCKDCVLVINMDTGASEDIAELECSVPDCARPNGHTGDHMTELTLKHRKFPLPEDEA